MIARFSCHPTTSTLCGRRLVSCGLKVISIRRRRYFENLLSDARKMHTGVMIWPPMIEIIQGTRRTP